MNSADVFSLEFDVLTRTSALAGTLEWFRGNALGAATHRQLLLELNYVINVHSRLREIAVDVVPAEDWSACATGTECRRRDRHRRQRDLPGAG